MVHARRISGRSATTTERSPVAPGGANRRTSGRDGRGRAEGPAEANPFAHSEPSKRSCRRLSELAVLLGLTGFAITMFLAVFSAERSGVALLNPGAVVALHVVACAVGFIACLLSLAALFTSFMQYYHAGVAIAVNIVFFALSLAAWHNHRPVP